VFCEQIGLVPPQHTPLQATWPPPHVKQSFFAALQPPGQDDVLVTQAPDALHAAALVLVVPEQVAPAPQEVFTIMLVVSVQTITPVEQDVVPFLQGFAGLQG
jgi:hypothetical protein